MIHDCRFFLALLILVAFTEDVDAQFTNVHFFEGGPGSYGTDADVDAAGDVNGDGVPDYLVGSSTYGSSGGHLIVFSGSDGATIHHRVGADGGGAIGISVAGLGDINGDGFDDFMAGVTQDNEVANSGIAAQVFSGLTGNLLYSFMYPMASDLRRVQVAKLGDINGDNVNDFGIGLAGSGFNFEGQVRLYSGIDGTLIREYFGAAGDYMGSSLAGIGDVNGDGFADVAVGANQSDTVNVNGFIGLGRVDVFSGLSGALLHSTTGAGLHSFGTSVIGIGDLSGDGVPDYVVGAPGNGPNFGGGGVGAYSGANGNVIPGVGGSQPLTRLGTMVHHLGDLDGDGLAEFSAETQSALGANSIIFRGGGGSLTPFAAPVQMLFPTGSTSVVAGIGDINGDGQNDVASAVFRKYTNGSADQHEVHAFINGTDPVLSYSSQSGNPAQMTLTWTQPLFDRFGANGKLECTGATPGASGLILASLAAADIPIFGFDLLTAVDPINLVLTATLGATAAGTFHVSNISRRNPAIAGSKIFVQFIETGPIIRASNGIRFIAIP